jgi:hypothetical protein
LGGFANAFEGDTGYIEGEKALSRYLTCSSHTLPEVGETFLDLRTSNPGLLGNDSSGEYGS